MVDFKKGAEELLNVLPLLESPGEPGREGEEVWGINRTGVTLSYYCDRWHSLPCVDGVCMGELTAPEYVKTRDQATLWLRIEMYQIYLQALQEDAALTKYRAEKAQTVGITSPLPDCIPTKDLQDHSAVVYGAGTSSITLRTQEEQYEDLLKEIRTGTRQTIPKGFEMKVTCVLKFVMPDNAVLNVHFEEIGAILEREEYPAEITLRSGKTYFPCCIPNSPTDDVVENILSLRLWRRLVKQHTPLDELIRESMESGEAVPWDADAFFKEMDAKPFVMNKGRHISLSLGTARLLAQNGENVENLT